MPIIIPKDIPAYASLRSEKIFVMDAERAGTQDIRPLEVAIVNLMPTKEVTETQLMRLLGNTPLQVNIHLIGTASYKSTHVSEAHMQKFYRSIAEVKKMKFDGMIVTGAPVETIPFEEVKYWNELVEIMDFARENVTSTIYICWGAQAALYHFWGIGKQLLDKKLFGVFPTHAMQENDMLLKGMDDTFYIPHSRHTRVDEDAVRACPDIKVLASSPDAGISIAKTHDNRMFFFTGHAEYDRFQQLLGFKTDLCKVAHPFTKGRVERLVRYIKGNFIKGRTFLNVNDLNRQALVWCADRNARPTSGTDYTPSLEHHKEGTRILSEDERPLLLPYLAPRRNLSFDRFVEYEGRRYGVPLPYTRRSVRVMRDREKLSVLDSDDFHELASYTVDWSGKDKTCPGQWDLGAPQCPQEKPTAPVHDLMRIKESASDVQSDVIAGFSILAELEKEARHE